MALLVKFGYIGTCFTGFQKGNGSNSVEDSILTILKEHDISESIRSAARTDRNVSASGNAFILKSDMQPEKILKILNAYSNNLFFHGYSEVGDSFNPRYCRSKRYVYLLRDPMESFVKTIKKFEGEHDFSAYCRKDSRSTLRRIESIQCNQDGQFLNAAITAQSFVWEQIRSIIGFCNSPSMQDHFADPFNNPPDRRIVAPPEPLLLEDITYDGVEFIKSTFAAKEDKLRASVKDLEMRAAVEHHILSALGNKQEDYNKQKLS